MHQLLAFDSSSFSWHGLQNNDFVPVATEPRSLFSGNSYAHLSTEYLFNLPGVGLNFRHRGHGNPRGGSEFTHEVIMCVDRQVRQKE